MGRSELYSPLFLPCGARAFFDQDSGISFRCEVCFAVVGSIAQPQSCKEQAAVYESLEHLGGQGWDYHTGRQKK